MLVVQDRIENETSLGNSKTFNVDEFIWPHGITPPLHHVRKRRFRKRANKRVRKRKFDMMHGQIVKHVTQTIESVEQEVERLLEADSMADTVKYGMIHIDAILKLLCLTRS
jgi:transcription initiation factor TFIID subunit 7